MCTLDDSRSCQEVFEWEHFIPCANRWYEFEKNPVPVGLRYGSRAIDKSVVDIHKYKLYLKDLECAASNSSFDNIHKLFTQTQYKGVFGTE